MVSYDIDVLAPTTETLLERLEALGFERQGRHWVAPEGRAVLETPGSFPEPGAKVVEAELPSGRSLLVLSLEDVLLDRLGQFRSGAALPIGFEAQVVEVQLLWLSPRHKCSVADMSTRLSQPQQARIGW